MKQLTHDGAQYSLIYESGLTSKCISTSLPLPPSNRHQRRRNLSNPALRRQQIELRRRIPRVLYLEPNAQVIKVLAHVGRDGVYAGSGADD
jgi:hypothetical protein